MLKIKLQRTGKRDQPHYRIVVAEARSKRDGKVTDTLGHYAPNHPQKLLQLDHQKYADWIAKGARPTDTVRQLFQKPPTKS